MNLLVGIAYLCSCICGACYAHRISEVEPRVAGGVPLPHVQPVSMGEIQAIAPSPVQVGPLDSLDSLPWERIVEPPPSYQHRTVVECGGRPAETLLDTGAAFSFVFEEVVILILNQAIADGLTHDSPRWPLAGLHDWGYDSPATSASQGGKMQVRGIVILRLTFVGICGRREVRCIEFRCFREGCGQGVGLTLGGPALDPSPIGLGFTPKLAGHQFLSLIHI